MGKTNMRLSGLPCTTAPRQRGSRVYREFVEVETGKGADAMDRRPQLKAALTAAYGPVCDMPSDIGIDRK
jgi:hypothetical protein